MCAPLLLAELSKMSAPRPSEFGPKCAQMCSLFSGFALGKRGKHNQRCKARTLNAIQVFETSVEIVGAPTKIAALISRSASPKSNP
jgi:hypothetical protein